MFFLSFSIAGACVQGAGGDVQRWLLALYMLALNLWLPPAVRQLQSCRLKNVSRAVQDDLELVREVGRGNVNITVGSALDIFGGNLPYADVLEWHRQQR